MASSCRSNECNPMHRCRVFWNSSIRIVFGNLDSDLRPRDRSECIDQSVVRVPPKSRTISIPRSIQHAVCANSSSPSKFLNFEYQHAVVWLCFRCGCTLSMMHQLCIAAIMVKITHHRSSSTFLSVQHLTSFCGQMPMNRD